MSVILLKNQASNVSVYVEDTAGDPALLLADTDVTVTISKDGGAYLPLNTPLSATSWTEVSGGWYSVDLEVEDTDTLGSLYLRVEGVGLKTSLTAALVSVAAPSPGTSLAITTTSMFGYVLNVDGSAAAGAAVSARILAVPSVGTSGGEGYVQSEGLVTATADSSGFFTMELVTGAQVDFFIPSANYRRTFQVPSSSTNVFDLP